MQTAPAADVRPEASLKSHVMRGSFWTVVGYGASQILRFGSNIVLTKLLFPEAFGLMALVSIVMYGLNMFSDIGAGPAIIRDKRGDDPLFLNTAWTLQVGRGFALWACASLLAWPLADFYAEPQLRYLIPTVGLTAVLNGLNSTSMHTVLRHMDLARFTMLELMTQIVTLGVMLSLAMVYPNVWSLVIGGLVGNTLKLILSHTYLPGIKNRFAWDPAARNDLFQFGKWIFLSSALFFVAKKTDGLLVGKFAGLAMLGIYSIANNLSEMPAALNLELARRVMFPAISRVHRESPQRVSEVFYRGRLALDAAFLPALGALMMVGVLIIRMIYDKRYQDAGWIFEILCVQSALRCMMEPCEQCVTAIGFPRYVTITHFVRTSWILIGIPLGWYLGGLLGVVWAASSCELGVIAIYWWALARHGILRWKYELRAVSFVLGGLALGELIYKMWPSHVS